MKPLVSVIIPTFNRANNLHIAILSVINQTYANWEIIIVDDNSSDETETVIRQYINNKINIKYFKHDKNYGASFARNTGINKSAGEYLSFLDSDDEWLPEHLMMSIEAMQKHNVEISYSFWIEKNFNREEERIFEKGESLRKRFDKAIEDSYITMIDDKIAFLKAPAYIEYANINKVYCNHINTLVMSKKVIKECGYFDTKLYTSEDDDFSFRILLKYNALVIMEYLFIYHQGSDNLYNFFDRRTANYEKLSKDEEMVKRISHYLLNNYNFIIKKRNVYLENKKQTRNKEFLKACKKQLIGRTFTIAYINRYLNKKLALKYLFKSMSYKFRIIDLKLLANIASNGLFCNKNNYDPYINF